MLGSYLISNIGNAISIDDALFMGVNLYIGYTLYGGHMLYMYICNILSNFISFGSTLDGSLIVISTLRTHLTFIFSISGANILFKLRNAVLTIL